MSTDDLITWLREALEHLKQSRAAIQALRADMDPEGFGYQAFGGLDRETLGQMLMAQRVLGLLEGTDDTTTPRHPDVEEA